ncbi:Leucine-rich repeat and calponin homology domain-containing protein 3 [Bagarius yarrelli]|uniref:Leucine-rich repeat and calponin homology domain-containing protein 3 n=1 Tax=Bagarius yarrelli TaxID=175774 RepID=A0A556V8J1_BAGYA|nr:Leucine-rich repeat and calponin homology domain-containing protein 3 [Bagarius yarrelli]
MAASVLLSAESTVPGFAVRGNSGASGTVGNGLTVPGPASWNRSLERAFEEAAATGCLNLSGRKLKEFPRSAANHDLSDTTRADLSRNRLPELPVEVCMFVSLENLNLYQNCLRSLPESLINLQALTYLNISRNQVSTLPAYLCSLPLKVLIACNNKLVSLPEDVGQLRQLTELICIKGKIHIFKYLNMEACKIAPDLSDYDRRPLAFGSCVFIYPQDQSATIFVCVCVCVSVEELYPGRPYGALDSGFNSVDSGDKRWSGNEPSDELSDLPLRVAELTREQRQRRERERDEHKTGSPLANGILESELDQIDFIDSCAGEEEEEDGRSRGREPVSLSSQFMAYIERRITREVGSPVKATSSRDPRNEDSKRYLHNRYVSETTSTLSSPSHSQRPGSGVGLERIRREAQLAAQRYEEERQRTRGVQREPVRSYAKQKSQAQSPSKLSPTDSENIESRLKVSLPSDLGAALTDGVVLCHLANHVRPRSVPSIHVPSPAVPKLTMAKCRRNVENFLEACRKIGVPQLCLPLHILEEKGLEQVAGTVRALLQLAPVKNVTSPTSSCAFSN